MKKKIISLIIMLIIVLSICSNVYAYTTTGRFGKFSLSIPNGYDRINNYYDDFGYLDMETYNSNDGLRSDDQSELLSLREI